MHCIQPGKTDRFRILLGVCMETVSACYMFRQGKKRTVALWLAISFAFLAIESPLFADKKELFAEAQATFDQGLLLSGQKKRMSMLKAAQLFLTVHRKYQVENGFLFFNIGNAYYEAGELGKAILYYRRAQRLIPGSPELEYNMNLARQDLNVPILTENWWDSLKKGLFFWHFMFDFNTRKVAFMAAFGLFWAALTVGIFNRHILIKTLSIFLLIVSLGLGGSYAISTYDHYFSKAGILIDAKTEVRKGPSKSYEKFYEQPLPGGMEFKLLDEQGQWWKIELPNGDQCWMESRSGKLI